MPCEFSMWRLLQVQLPHLLRKIRVLEDEKLQLRAGCYCVPCIDLTSVPILFSFLRFQLKIKPFQGLFFFSHAPALNFSACSKAVLWPLTLVSPFQRRKAQLVRAHRRQHIRAQQLAGRGQASAVCRNTVYRNTVHSISLLL